MSGKKGGGSVFSLTIWSNLLREKNYANRIMSSSSCWSETEFLNICGLHPFGNLIKALDLLQEKMQIYVSAFKV